MHLMRLVTAGFVSILASAAATASPRCADAQSIPVLVTGRVVDSRDTIPLRGVIVEFNSDGHIIYATTDSSGHFVANAVLRQGALKADFHNGFYLSTSLERGRGRDNKIDFGMVLLKRGPEPIEYMVIPTCVPLNKRPPVLEEGTWIQRDWGSKRKSKLLLCDGLLRDPRVRAL